MSVKWAAQVAANNAAAAAKKVAVDALVKSNDLARALKAENELAAFKAKAEANAKSLKRPDRECFDADDTRRVQSIFKR